ncbi:MAG TPA: ATP-binding cassette domain-containing protein [Anaerolineae bacterium]|nr:ATP-binding cassette domain-containing protein [Anaerolineae bacterium]
MTLISHPPLLQLRGISKHFGAVQALIDVDFDVCAGEVVGLVGDNGAGKSTLVKGISGIFPFDAGEYIFESRRQIIRSPQDVVRLGIETVYQDLALCDNLDVVANLYLGRENSVKQHTNPLAAVDEIAMEKRTLDVLHGLAVELPNVRVKTAALSGGQRQAVAVARAVMWNSKLVLLDEPTAALGMVQTRQVLDLIQRLRKQGLGVVVVSHQLATIFEMCDRIVVLRLGRNGGNFVAQAASFDQIVTAITGNGFSNENGFRDRTQAG